MALFLRRFMQWAGVLLLAVAMHPAAAQQPAAPAGGEPPPLPRLWGVEHGRPVRGVAFRPDGKVIAAANADGTIRLADAATGKTLRTLTGHRDRANGVAFSPDGQLLASASRDHTVRLWNAQTGALLRTLAHPDQVRCVRFSPDGRLLATGADDRAVRLWNPRTGALASTLPDHLGGIMGVAFSPDGKTLASGDGVPAEKGEIRLWNVAAGTPLGTLRSHTSDVWAVAFSPDGKTLASVASDYTIKLWQPGTGRLLRSFREGSSLTSLAFSPEGRLLAVGTFRIEGTRISDGVVHVRSVATGRLAARLTGLQGAALSVAFSPDGTRLVSGSGYEADDDRRPGELTAWNTTGLAARVAEWERTPELALRIGHRGHVAALAYSPDGRHVASGNFGTPGEIKIWDPRTGELERTIHSGPAPILGLSWSPSSEGSPAWLAVAAWNGIVQLWDPGTGDLLWERRLYTGPIYSVAFAPDGKRFASAGQDRIVRLWDAASGELERALPAAASPLRSVAYSPDGKRLVTAGEAGAVQVWEAATGAAVRSLAGHQGTVNCARFSPDRKFIATAGDDRTVRLWNAETGEAVRSMTGHPDPAAAVAFTPDGTLLASASGGLSQPVPRAEARLWDARTGAALRTCATGSHLAAAVAFAPDGHTLAVGAGELVSGEVQLWNPERGDRRLTLAGQQNAVAAVAISPDGTQAAAAVGQTLKGAVKVWDLRSGLVARTIPGDTGRVEDLAISADGKLLATGSWNEVRIRDTASGQVLRTIRTNDGGVGLLRSLALSPDGTLLATATVEQTGPGEIRISEVGTGRLVRRFSGHTGAAESVTFSPDGRILAAAGADRTVRLWDAQTGAALQTLAGHNGTVTAVRFSPDGQRIASTSMDAAKGEGEVRIWNARTGALERTLSGQIISRSLAFSPDGAQLAVSAVDFREEGVAEDVRLYEVATGRLLRAMAGHAASVNALAFSRDGARLVSGGDDNTVRIWDPRAGRLLATLLTLPVEETIRPPAGARPITVGDKDVPLPDEYLAFTPEGYYAGSAAADRYVRFRLRDRQFPAESFQARYYRPDLVKKALAGEPLPPPPALKGDFPPLVHFTAPAAAARITGSTLQVTLQAADDRAIRDVALFVNGTRVAARPIVVGDKPIVPDAKVFPATHGAARTVTATLPLAPGEGPVRVQAIAYDDDGLQSPREEILFSREPGTATAGRLLGVCVGVSRYRDHALDLRYAQRDAVGLAAELNRQRGLYRGAEVTSLTDEAATAPGVRAALDSLAGRVTRADTVVVFLSGHGWRAADQRFYFATHEVDRSGIEGTALPWSDVVQRLLRLSEKSRRVIVLLDACHSGSAATNEELVKSLLAANAGVLVLASSKGAELSLESEELQHGVFTKAVLEAIGGQAAPPGERSVTVLDFLSYVARRVRFLTGDAQHPHVPYLQDFDTDTAFLAAGG